MCQVTIIGDWKLPQLTFCHKWHTEGGYSEAFSVKKLFQSPNWILAYNPPWQCVRRQLATEKHIFYYSVKMYPCLQYFPIYWSVSNISQYIGLSVINPNLLDCLWYVPLNLKELLICMTQYIGWTTTPEPLNLKAGLLYMTQYIWSYSFAAQSKLMPYNDPSMTQ